MHEDMMSKKQQDRVGRFVRATMFRRRSDRTWPVPEHLSRERVRFVGNNGADLAGTWFPVADAKGVVVLAHPDRRYGQHWFVREGWIDWLTSEGYSVFTFDFVQYGGSRGGSTFLYQDLLLAVDEARRHAPDSPIHVVGLSLGAFAAAVASPWLDVDSLVLESPYPDFGAWYANAPPAARGIGRAAMATFGALFPQTGRTIRADRRIPDALAKRILVVASQTDAVTPYALSQRVAAAGPADRTELMTLNGRDHLAFFRDSPAYRRAILHTFEAADADRTPRIDVGVRQARAALLSATPVART